METKQYIEKAINTQKKWVLEIVERLGWDKFYQLMGKGEIIELPIEVLVPRSFTEWEDSAPGGSYTSGPIEISLAYLAKSRETKKAEFVVYDGHNRLKSYLADGKKTVSVLIV